MRWDESDCQEELHTQAGTPAPAAPATSSTRELIILAASKDEVDVKKIWRERERSKTLGSALSPFPCTGGRSHARVVLYHTPSGHAMWH